MADKIREYQVKNCAVIILAAGKSSRLGSPKQLLVFQDQYLLQHGIDEAISSNASPVITVLGANHELIRSKIDHAGSIIVENTDWETGIASSIKTGLNEILSNHPKTDGIMLMVCDQPFADHKIINQLLKAQDKTKKGIICCSYDGTIGTPALFHKSFFDELFTLEGDTGAKKLMLKHKDDLFSVSFSDGSIDIDTPEDYKNLAK